MVLKAAKSRKSWSRPAQRLQVLRKATLAIPLLLTFVTAGWEQSRAADPAKEDAAQPADCRDVTPHEVTFVTVEPGVQLEVLDFGGSGEIMVLLTGLGDNAHVWDDFAYQFTDYFGSSALPAGGMVNRTSPQKAMTFARGRATTSRSSTTSRSAGRSSSATPSREQS
jgi:hypothetical protein